MKRPITLVIVTLWSIVTAISAYIYVDRGVHSPAAMPGYETDWHFHLWMFAIFLFPLFVVGLVVALLLERRVRFDRTPSHHDVTNISPDVVFPLTVRFEDGSSEVYEDQRHLACNLEDFDSERDSDCDVQDALGRQVFLKLKLLSIKELRLK